MINTKKITIQLSFVFAFSVTLFMYTNATQVDTLMIDLVNESDKVEKSLRQGVFKSDYSKGIMVAHQNRIGNLIALRLKAQSCEELKSVEKNLKSGLYNLYPSGKKAIPFYCHINQSGLVEHAIVVKKEKARPSLPKMEQMIEKDTGFLEKNYSTSLQPVRELSSQIRKTFKRRRGHR